MICLFYLGLNLYCSHVREKDFPVPRNLRLSGYARLQEYSAEVQSPNQCISESTVANVTSPADQSRRCCSPDWVGSKSCMPIPASCMWELILNLTILELTAFQAPPAVTKINSPPAFPPVQNSLGDRGYVFLVRVRLWWHRSQRGCNKAEAFPGLSFSYPG